MVEINKFKKTNGKDQTHASANFNPKSVLT